MSTYSLARLDEELGSISINNTLNTRLVKIGMNDMDDNEKKQPSQPLDNSCGVCESPASSVFHYGAIVCFSCR